MAPAPTPAPVPAPSPAPPGGAPPAATPKPIDQAKATAAIQKFRDAVAASAADKIADVEGAKAARSALSAAVSEIKSAGDWSETTLTEFATAASVGVDELRTLLSTMSANATNLSNAFDTQFTSVLGAGDATKKLAATLNDAAIGQALGSTVVELDKVVLRLQGYAKVAQDTANLGTTLKGGVGGLDLGLQKEMFKSGLLDDGMAKNLQGHLMAMSGHITAQADSLRAMWNTTMGELETLGAQKAAIDQQLAELGDRKAALAKEEAERQRTISYQSAEARANKEKELTQKEREISITEQGLTERQTALGVTRAEVERLRAEARGLEGDAKKAVVERQKQLEREYFARQEVLDKDKEGLEARRAEIASERDRVSEGLRLASDRAALESERVALTERTTLAEEESTKITDEKTKLAADKTLFDQRSALMTDLEKQSQQAILDARQSELTARETANNTEKAAIENKKKETAMTLLQYQDQASIDAERAQITAEQQALNSEKDANITEQNNIQALKDALNTERASLDTTEIASREAAIADRENILEQKKSSVTERESLLAQKDSQNAEANRLYTDRTALDREKSSLDAREAVANAEVAAIQTETNQLAADRAALAQQTNLTAEQRAAKEAEFAAKDRELAARNDSLSRERQLIAEQNIELQRSDAIVRANEREAIRKANEAASNKEIAARREAQNAEEARLNDEKKRLNESFIDTEKRQKELIASLNKVESAQGSNTEAIKMFGTKWIEDFRSAVGKYSESIDYQNSTLRMQEKWAIFEGNNLQQWREAIASQKEEIDKRREELKQTIATYELQKNSAEGLSEAARLAMEASIVQQEAALKTLEASVEKAGAETSPITQAFQNAIKPLIKEVKRTADYQDARFNLIGDVAEMGWFNARGEAKRLKQEEKFFAERKKAAEKEMDMLKAQHEAGMISTEEFQTSFAVAAKDLKEFADAEKTTKGRRKQVEERVEKGILGNQLEKLNKAMSKMTDGMKKAASHWITKVLGLLILFGFLIRRGILTPSRIAKVVALLVDFVVKGLKALFKLLIIGLIAVVKSIFMMFAQGNILAGVISTLVFVIVSLLVLAHLINLASIGWAKIAGAATTISSAFMNFSDGLKKLTGIDLAGFFDELGNKMKDGFKKMFGMVSDKVTEAASTVANQAGPKYKNLGTKGVVSAERKAELAAMSPEQRKELLRDKLASNRGFADQREAARMSSVTPGGARPSGVGSAIRGAPSSGVTQAATVSPPGGAGGVGRGVAGVGRGAAPGVGGAVPGVGGGAVPPATPPKGADKFGGFLKKLADSLKQLGSSKVVRGAATLALLATGVMMIAAAFVLFSKVSWQGVIIGLAAIGGLIYMTKMLSKAVVQITIGSLALKQLAISFVFFAGSLMVLALAMRLFNDVEWGSLIKAGLAIVMFSFLMIKIVPFAPLILAGAYTIALVGLALLPLVFAMNFMKGFEFKSLIVLGLGIYALAILVASMAFLLPWVILGGITIAALGLALMPMVIALQMAKGLQLGGALVLVVATFLFGEIAYALAQLAKSVNMDDIIKASLMIGMIGLAVIPMAIALQMSKGIQLNSALILVAATFLFGSIAYGLALLSKLVSFNDVFKGGLMIGMIGVALIPMAAALLMANGIKVGAAILLATAVIVFGSIAYGLALLSKVVSFNDVIKGGLMIALIGLAMIPLAAALHLAKGITLSAIGLMLTATITFGLVGLAISSIAQFVSWGGILKGAAIIALIGFAVMPMSWALSMVKGIKIEEALILLSAVVVFTGIALLLGSPWLIALLPMILIGASVIFAIGLAVLPMAEALNKMKGVSPEQAGILLAAVLGFSLIAVGIGFMATVVPYALIMFGVLIITAIGYAVRPMAEALNMVKGLNWEQMWILMVAVAGFSGIAIAIGALTTLVPYKMILMGALIMAAVGLAVIPMAYALSLVNGVSWEAIWVLGTAIIGFTGLAMLLGSPWFIALRPMIEEGAFIIGLIGLAVLPMAYALSLVRGLNLESVAVLVGATLGFAAIAAGIGWVATAGGVGIAGLLIGIGIIFLIGLAIQPMAYALSLAKGLEPESAWAMVAATLGFAAIASAMGLLLLATGGLGAVAIAAGAGIIWMLGHAVMPMAYALSLAKGLNPADLDVLEAAIWRFLGLAMKLAWYGLLLPAIAAGAYVMSIVGNAVIPMAVALGHAKGLDVASVEALAFATYVLVHAAIFAGSYFVETLLGSFALIALGAGLESMSKGVSALRGITVEDALGMGMAIVSLVDAAVYAGQNFIAILFGAWALSVLGGAISAVNKDLGPFADNLAKLAGLPEPLLKLSESLERLGAAITAFGGEIGSLTDEEISKLVQITGSVSSSGASSSGGGVMEEIRNILEETKEIHVQQAGNNVVAVNQSNVSSSNTSVEPPIVKNNRAADHYFSRLSFKHHI